MPFVIAKYWEDTGNWEFESPDDEVGLKFVESGKSCLVDIPQELLDSYQAALVLRSKLSQEIYHVIEAARYK